ncbi:hypothetical protein [Vibrio phage JSF7]|uniref:Toprim domain-containing protein n=1 Tax=Vibrio phage JSF7 TaxID=1292086 RepID=A0A240EWT9_9CAUD|nr:hypothetical protein HOQ92_gp05 [Vibrio phage JSF7]APD18129.1 hypothetical protein [Vibrio phage JSF7]
MRNRYEHRWLSAAKELRSGTHGRIDCPNCGWGTGTGAAIINHNLKDYSVFCNACKLVEKLPKGLLSLAELKELREAEERSKERLPLWLPHDYTLEIPEVGRQWLYKCGISPSYWQMLRIGWSDYYKRVVLPVYNHEGVLVWYQLRAVYAGQKPKYIQPARSKDCVYTVNNGTKPIAAVVVEDIASAIRINLLRLPFVAYAIMGTSLTPKQLETLISHGTVLTWFDPDKAGEAANKRIRHTLGLWVNTRQIRSHVDPKKLSNQELTLKLLEAMTGD